MRLQERVKHGHVMLRALAGSDNYADVLTKVTSASRLTEVLGNFGFWASRDPCEGSRDRDRQEDPATTSVSAACGTRARATRANSKEE